MEFISGKSSKSMDYLVEVWSCMEYYGVFSSGHFYEALWIHNIEKIDMLMVSAKTRKRDLITWFSESQITLARIISNLNKCTVIQIQPK